MLFFLITALLQFHGGGRCFLAAAAIDPLCLCAKQVWLNLGQHIAGARSTNKATFLLCFSLRGGHQWVSAILVVLSALVEASWTSSCSWGPTNTLRQKSVQPKNKTTRHNLGTVVSAVHRSEEWTDLYLGETKCRRPVGGGVKTQMMGGSDFVHYQLLTTLLILGLSTKKGNNFKNNFDPSCLLLRHLNPLCRMIFIRAVNERGRGSFSCTLRVTHVFSHVLPAPTSAGRILAPGTSQLLFLTFIQKQQWATSQRSELRCTTQQAWEKSVSY